MGSSRILLTYVETRTDIAVCVQNLVQFDCTDFFASSMRLKASSKSTLIAGNSNYNYQASWVHSHWPYSTSVILLASYNHVRQYKVPPVPLACSNKIVRQIQEYSAINMTIFHDCSCLLMAFCFAIINCKIQVHCIYVIRKSYSATKT